MGRGRRAFGYIEKQRSGRYRASYVDPHTGARVAAPTTFAAKADANTWLASVQTDHARGELVDVQMGRLPFEEWSARWLSGLHVRPSTYLGYESCLRNHVLPTFGLRPVASIRYADCKQFVDGMLAAGLAAGTVSEARKILRMVLAEALRHDAIRRNPAEGLRVPRGARQEMVFLSHDEVLDLAHAITHPTPTKYRPPAEHPQYGLLVCFTALTGLRAGEVAALRIGRVNQLRGRVEVAESATERGGHLYYGPTKTYERRTVPIPSTVARDLVQHLETRPSDPDAFVFTSPDGRPLRHRNFYGRHYKRAVVQAGLDPRTRFHDLRHTAAALMIAEGAHLLAVKERLGHSSIQVTADRYGHLFPSLEEALTAKLDASFRAAIQRGSSAPAS
jgi:integrase